MPVRPLYENLDTSFVNLSALVGYLRRRRAACVIRLARADYEAEIRLSAENELDARETDRRTGAHAFGEDALKRILIRAREPGGRIDVEAAEPRAAGEHIAAANEKNAGGAGLARALDEADRSALVGLLGELLGVVDEALGACGVDFAPRWRQAREACAVDFPFLPAVGYERGRLRGAARPRAGIFAAGLAQALRRLFEQLASDPALAEAHRAAAQRVISLRHRRRADCDRFRLTPVLDQMLGL